MKRKKSAFKESLLSVPYGRRHVQTGATPGQTVTSLCLMLTSQHAISHVQTGATPGQTVTPLCLMLTSKHA